MAALSAEPVVLLDLNTLSADGTVALAIFDHDDGNLMAYGLSRAGRTGRIGRCATRTGQDFADEVHWVKFSSASWTKDNRGFSTAGA
jgi:prolyl oligopeptidase